MGHLEWIPSPETPSVIKLQKNDVLKCIDELTDIIYETIPVVGPIATNYKISALFSIFSVVDRREPIGTAGSDFFMELSGFDKSKETEKKKEIDRIIKESYDTAGKIQAKELQSAIDVLRQKKDELDNLTPDLAADKISPLIKSMKDQRDSLIKQQQQLEQTLKSQVEQKDYKQTAPRVELYLFTSAWLFVYNKVCNEIFIHGHSPDFVRRRPYVVHLLGFQARSHLISGETDKYVSTMIDWNQEFTTARHNVFTTAYFLTNDVKDKTPDYGLLVMLNTVRTGKDYVKLEESSITDPWPETAFGYFKDDPALKLSLVTSLGGFSSDAKKVAFNLYKESYFRFFNLSVQSLVRRIENWKDCLAKWNRQCPISPPKYDEDGKIIKYIVSSATPVTETGYKGPGTLCYAISYVTSRGEGALSDWTEPTPLTEAQNYHVEVTVEGVKQLFDPLAGYELADMNARAGNTGKGVETIRRVYVKYTSEGQTIVSRVWDMKPSDTKFTDKGFEKHLL